MSITKQVEKEFKFFDSEGPRLASVNFYQRIIEDLTGEDVMGIGYDSEDEFFTVAFLNPRIPNLLINVRLDSLQACTKDVIRQTQAWIDEQRKKSQVG